MRSVVARIRAAWGFRIRPLMSWSPPSLRKFLAVFAWLHAGPAGKIDNILQIIEPSPASHAVAVVPKTGTLACWEPLPYAAVYPPLIV
jgi:hypothetical protein